MWIDWRINGGSPGGIAYPIWAAVLLVGNLALTLSSYRYKQRLVRLLQKWVINPPVRWSLRAHIPLGWALLETTGRKTGKSRVNPVGNGRIGDTFWLIAEHGERAAYVKNLRAHPRVRLLLRTRGLRMEWRTGVATVLPDVDPLSVQRRIGGWRHPVRALNAMTVRVLGAGLLTIRIDLEAWEGGSNLGPEPAHVAHRLRALSSSDADECAGVPDQPTLRPR